MYLQYSSGNDRKVDQYFVEATGKLILPFLAIAIYLFDTL